MNLKKLAANEARRHGLDPHIFLKQITAESNWNAHARSPAGARGVAQFMPATARAMGVNPDDPVSSIKGAARLMSSYVKKYGNYRDSLVAYNGGPGAVKNPPAESRNYVATILGGGAGPAPSAPRSVSQTTTSQKSTFDQAGYQQAVQRQRVATLLSSQGQAKGNPLFASGLLSTVAPDPNQFIKHKLVQSVTSSPLGAPAGGTGPIAQEASRIASAHVPYLWGGGHAGPQPRGSKVTPLDCSGAVSRVLGINPRVASQYMGWGKPGRGKSVTIYANNHHVIMEINGRFWGTSHANPGGGAGWIPRSQISKAYLAQFVARHPPGQ